MLLTDPAPRGSRSFSGGVESLSSHGAASSHNAEAAGKLEARCSGDSP